MTRYYDDKLTVNFPYRTVEYWWKMAHKKIVHVFGINGFQYVLASVEANEDESYPPSSIWWEQLNQETCKVTFQRLYRLGNKCCISEE